MAQHRDLHPVTVYLPREVADHFRGVADAAYEPVSATLRRIIVERYRATRPVRTPGRAPGAGPGSDR